MRSPTEAEKMVTERDFQPVCSRLWEMSPMRNWRKIESKMGVMVTVGGVWRDEAP